MKWNSEIKSQFSIFILSSNLDQGAALKTAIHQEGFEAYLFSDTEVLLSRVKESPPHIIVFELRDLTELLQKFIQIVLDISSEIRFLPLANYSDIQELSQLREFNFSGIVLKGDGLYTRACWLVDETCKNLYLTYQNEQVYSLYEKAQKETNTARADQKLLERRVESVSGIAVNDELAKFKNVKSKEDVLHVFLREINQKFLAKNKKVSAIYFKYLYSLHSFVAMQSLGLDIETLKGVGGRLTMEEMKDPNNFFISGGVPEQLASLMLEGLRAQHPVIKTIYVRDSVDGFLVIWGSTSELYGEEIENEFALFALMYERAHLIRYINSLDLADSVTQLNGRPFYLKRLTEEVARARRLQQAVSVIKLSIDHWPELEQALGTSARDQVLRTISGIIQKTSRVNDISCRTAECEISLILPHSARKGASVRGERLRRLIENQAFQVSGLKITVSIGISEYPSLCSSADELEKSSEQSLVYIKGKGGNKVCLYQASDTFKPEYEVPL